MGLLSKRSAVVMLDSVMLVSSAHLVISQKITNGNRCGNLPVGRSFISVILLFGQLEKNDTVLPVVGE